MPGQNEEFGPYVSLMVNPRESEKVLRSATERIGYVDRWVPTTERHITIVSEPEFKGAGLTEKHWPIIEEANREILGIVNETRIVGMDFDCAPQLYQLGRCVVLLVDKEVRSDDYNVVCGYGLIQAFRQQCVDVYQRHLGRSIGKIMDLPDWKPRYHITLGYSNRRTEEPIRSDKPLPERWHINGSTIGVGTVVRPGVAVVQRVMCEYTNRSPRHRHPHG